MCENERRERKKTLIRIRGGGASKSRVESWTLTNSSHETKHERLARREAQRKSERKKSWTKKREKRWMQQSMQRGKRKGKVRDCQLIGSLKDDFSKKKKTEALPSYPSSFNECGSRRKSRPACHHHNVPVARCSMYCVERPGTPFHPLGTQQKNNLQRKNLSPSPLVFSPPFASKQTSSVHSPGKER